MTTAYISTVDAKEEFADLINRVNNNKERIILTRRDKEVAAIISLEDLKLLLQISAKQDLDEATESLQEARAEGTITLEEFKQGST